MNASPLTLFESPYSPISLAHDTSADGNLLTLEGEWVGLEEQEQYPVYH